MSDSFLFYSVFVQSYQWRLKKISVYDWMKINESRFAKKKKRKANLKNQRIIHLNNSNNYESLDLFIEQEHHEDIFDCEFSKDDFLKLTKKWKDTNLEN